jgi:outer membrane protein assembly factor BamB
LLRSKSRVGVAVVALLAAAAIALSLLGSSTSAGGPRFTGSGYANVDTSNTRDTGGPIDSATVSGLQVAWSLPITGKGQFGSYASTPVIAGGVVYSEDLGSNVTAIELRTGKVLWTRAYEQPDHGPNGLVVAGGRVFGATSSAVFSLDEETGRQVWSVPLVQGGHAEIDMAPGYHNGIVYISTVPGDFHEPGAGEAAGVLWALDGRTGRKIWHFNTVTNNVWSTRQESINSGGGVWYPPAFDNKGFMYFGVANPEPSPGPAEYPWGSSRPGPDLYSDSIIKLDASTGRMQWYYQLTPHDLYDWDLQDPPMLVDIGDKQVVITAGKGGVVLAFDSQSGNLLWKRPVGTHNGHDNDDVYAMKHEYSKLKLPETVYPGRLGGVIAPMATDGSTVFVPVVNHPQVISKEFEVTEPETSSGEIVALSAATGAVRWIKSLSSPAYGAVTVANNVVFATSFTGSLFALNTSNGSVAWETQLPDGTNAGVSISGDTVIAPAGLALESAQTPEITAFRLPKGG